MNTLTTASMLPGRTARDLAVWGARKISRAMFAMSLAALESWLRFPIRPLFDGYLHSSMSRISSVAAAVLHHFLL